MTVGDIERVVEQWAPAWTAWERDNVGLQIGERTRQVNKILLALELTDGVVREAVKKKIDLIVTHHPPLFRPLASLTDSTQTGKNLLALARQNIAVYSAHTNLDAARDGVSFALARTLGLLDVGFLAPLENSLVKIVVFVPSSHVERLSAEMAEAGAGIIGRYDSCSFRTRGTGTFRGGPQTNPWSGKRGVLETVDETRLEMIAPKARVDAILLSIRRVHPYEEVAYDVIPVSTPNSNYGMGALGHLGQPVSLSSFLRSAKRALHAERLRFVGDPRMNIKIVAVCGGSGSDLVDRAIRAGADVFITADVRYHTFHAAAGRIALVDAGHWETEHGVLEPLQRKLAEAVRRSKHKVSIVLAQSLTNPIRSI
ncbi:MAG TPA: Nif3-like dinuclear metal center hexameric protein [Bacteroidota bacterium]|nr:Nif3-like dinuclear metal center hexameric protein [Bacteroidota bacterium]